MPYGELLPISKAQVLKSKVLDVTTYYGVGCDISRRGGYQPPAGTQPVVPAHGGDMSLPYKGHSNDMHAIAAA